MRRGYVGIDINPAYIEIARERIRQARAVAPQLLVGRARYPGRRELEQIAAAEAGNTGKAAAAKHKRKTYGRAVMGRRGEQPTAV